MFPWTNLPPELRHEVVKRMDFISRFRFRGVSKTDKRIVDSQSFYIPRICLTTQHRNKAQLTIYLGIENKIEVFFKKSKTDGKIHIKRAINGKPDRTFKNSRSNRNAFGSAVYAFRQIAMHPNTILGGFEFLPNGYTTHIVSYLFQILRGGVYRAKTLTIENGGLTFIMAFCSVPDLLEIQLLVDSPGWAPIVSYTKKERYRSVGKDVEELKKMRIPLQLDNTYILTETEDVTKLAASPQEFNNFLINWKVQKLSPNNYMSRSDTKDDNRYMQNWYSSCGIVLGHNYALVEKENPEACTMRWTCWKHADPFEHWYYKRLTRSQAIWHPEDSVLKFQGKLSYHEYVYPMINGETPMDSMLNQAIECFKLGGCTPLMLSDTKFRDELLEEMEHELEETSDEEEEDLNGLGIVVGSGVEVIGPHGVKIVDPIGDIKMSTDSEESEESEWSDEGNSDYIGPDGWSLPVNNKKAKEKPEILEVLEVSEESKEAPEKSEILEESQIYKGITEEIPVKSKKIDKFWKILMFFSVFSVLFAFFYTWFEL